MAGPSNEVVSAPAPSGGGGGSAGYDYVARRRDAVVALAEARGVEPAIAQAPPSTASPTRCRGCVSAHPAATHRFARRRGPRRRPDRPGRRGHERHHPGRFAKTSASGAARLPRSSASSPRRASSSSPPQARTAASAASRSRHSGERESAREESRQDAKRGEGPGSISSSGGLAAWRLSSPASELSARRTAATSEPPL